MKTFKEIRDEYGYVGLVELVEPEYGGDYGYVIYYKPNHLAVLHWNKGFKTYEEAEEACLSELNDIIFGDKKGTRGGSGEPCKVMYYGTSYSQEEPVP